ncbi:hypothetical protein EPYR_03011 [Erwinia pyrifoliae DSM 12163]|nr:hypothetical protein EPYR_03011 [Erwinia pyrifoliae DSM 12163]
MRLLSGRVFTSFALAMVAFIDSAIATPIPAVGLLLHIHIGKFRRITFFRHP